MNYDMDIDSEIFPASGECSFWLRGDSCGRTTCHECGADAAAALVANSAASITGVVVAARRLVVERDDPHNVYSRCRDLFIARVPRFYRIVWNWWFSGLWEAASGESHDHVLSSQAVEYGLGRIAYLAWRNAREENRRV